MMGQTEGEGLKTAAGNPCRGCETAANTIMAHDWCKVQQKGNTTMNRKMLSQLARVARIQLCQVDDVQSR